MEKSKLKVIWVLLGIVLFTMIIDASPKPDNITENNNKLLLARREKKLMMANDDTDNPYHLQKNGLKSKPETATKTNDGRLIELVNLNETEAENTLQSSPTATGSLSEDYPLQRSDVNVFDDYEEMLNESSDFVYTSKGINASVVDKPQSSKMSASTISWLESFMYLYRNWQWILFNTLFMVTWIFFAIFALYRLIGLNWCSSIFSRSLYLVMHLLIFTAATFSIVQLLHLSYGNYQGLPLFLTLLLTHTPSPCLALACCIVIRSILAATNVPMYGRYLATLTHVAVFSTVVLLLSFIGDVIVGISHSSIVLVVARCTVNALCVMPLTLFIYKYVQVRGIHRSLQKEFVRELKSLVPNRRNDTTEDAVDVRSVLRSILNPWAQLTVFGAACGIVMLLCNFSLSLFFTISHVSLALFWILHSTLFVSQVALVVSITVAVALTLVNVTMRNICQRYFIIPLPRTEPVSAPFVQHGNFIYQRVSVGNLCNGGNQHPNNLPTRELGESSHSNSAAESIAERPRINVRRSATFNCPPRAVYAHSAQPYANPVHPILSDHLLTTYPIDERQMADNRSTALLQFRNANYCSRKSNIRTHCEPISDVDERAFSPAKFPIMGCNGRSRYGSLHSLPNISPRNGPARPSNLQYYALNECEPFIRSIPENSPDVHTAATGCVVDDGLTEDVGETGNCVKEIIMENQNLFRSHSLRQNSLRRKVRNRERLSIRTVPPQVIGAANDSLSLENEKIIDDCERIGNSRDAKCVPIRLQNGAESVFYAKTFIDSPLLPYAGVENGIFYGPDSSECSSIHKCDPYTYEPRDVGIHAEMPNGKVTLVRNPIFNTDSERSVAASEVSSLKSEFSTCTQGDKCKDRFTENTLRKNASTTDKSYNSTDTEVNGDTNNHVETSYDKNNHVEDSYHVVNDEFCAFTLPTQKRASLKRNHSSTSFETADLPSDIVANANCATAASKNRNNATNWYGTWAGRKSKRRNLSINDGTNLRKLSASKSSLSNLYDKLKTRRYKSSMTSIDTLDVEENNVENVVEQNELVIVESKDESEDEMLPKISENIDLASEILKSSTMLADFLVNKDSDQTPDANFNSLDESTLQMSPFKVNT